MENTTPVKEQLLDRYIELYEKNKAHVNKAYTGSQSDQDIAAEKGFDNGCIKTIRNEMSFIKEILTT
jgi:hypothetical protein